MAIVALTNSSSPVTVERATADSDPYERETQLNGLALNFDAHDHTSAKGLAVGRLQTPAVSGVMTFDGDATLSRTSAGALRADTHLGVGVTPAAWGGMNAVQFGASGALWAGTTGATTVLSNNSYWDGSVNRAVQGGQFTFQLVLAAGGMYVFTAPAVAAGAAQTTTQRLQVDPAGNLAVGGTIFPTTDNAHNLGLPSPNRWSTVYASNGTIQTSSQERKEGITPLSPAECYQAAKDVTWYAFAYLPPAYQEPPEQEGQEPDDRQRQVDESKAAHARMLVETAPARHQRGFVYPTGDARDEAGGTLPPVPELFGLSDRESTTPQADLATLGCALQEVIRRLETLEGAAA